MSKLPEGATIEEDVGIDGAEEYYDENEYGGGLDEDDLQNLEEIEKFTGQINADDYEELTEEERQMHELELEMDKAALEAENTKQVNSPGGSSSGGAFLPAGAVPSKNGVLSPHAAEFWFPESRNCPCCSGFKHGCKCRSATVDTCKHPECENLEYKEQVASTLASRPEPSTASPRNSGAVDSDSPRGGGADICKFFLQGSCMRGNSCRYLHAPIEGGNASPVSPGSRGGGGGFGGGGMSPGQECLYFKRGNCQYGDNCRFSHGPSGYPPQVPY